VTQRRSNDPIRTGARKAKAQRQVGQGAFCVDCGDAETLVKRSRPKRCITCYAAHKTKKTTEGHHIAGKANSPIEIEVPTKDHRALTEAQYEWPPGALGNADGSPLIAAAGFLDGTAEFIEQLIVRGLHYIAEFLRKLDAWLRDHCDQLWWKGTEFDGWQPI